MSEEEELVEKDVREKSKRMCEGYYEGVSKILVKEHHVSPPSRSLYPPFPISSSLYAPIDFLHCKL